MPDVPGRSGTGAENHTADRVLGLESGSGCDAPIILTLSISPPKNGYLTDVQISYRLQPQNYRGKVFVPGLPAGFWRNRKPGTIPAPFLNPENFQAPRLNTLFGTLYITKNNQTGH